MTSPRPDRHHALHTLYSHHHGWLLGMLVRRTRNHADAQDLTSETFLQVVDSRMDPVVVQEPRAFLTTIAKRVLFHFRRRQALEQSYLAHLALLPEALAPSAEDRALAIEAIAEIDRALNGLPLAVRSAFLYSQLDGLSHEEIAAQLQVSVRTVSRHITRALEHCLLATAEPPRP
jgi:RNA polymerase sigma-70 factor (ECF subfamily)